MLVPFAVVDGGDDDDDTSDAGVVVVGLFAACLLVSLLLLASAAPYTHRNHKLCMHTVVSCTPHVWFGKKCDHIA